MGIHLLHSCLDALSEEDVTLCFDKLLHPNNAKRSTFDYTLNIIKYHIQFLKKNKHKNSHFVSCAIKYYSNTFQWKQQFMATNEQNAVKILLLDENLSLFLSLSLLNKTPHIFVDTISKAFGDDLTKMCPSRVAQFMNIDFTDLL